MYLVLPMSGITKKKTGPEQLTEWFKGKKQDEPDFFIAAFNQTTDRTATGNEHFPTNGKQWRN